MEDMVAEATVEGVVTVAVVEVDIVVEVVEGVGGEAEGDIKCLVNLLYSEL